jgi:hypothetical protein
MGASLVIAAARTVVGRAAALSRPAATGALVLILGLSTSACDEAPSSSGGASPAASAAAAAASSTPAAPPPEPQAPEIIVDHTNIDIGKNRIAAGEPGLADKALVFLRSAPKIPGTVASVVALRAAKPSSVAAILDALQQAGAISAQVKTETRDGATQPLPVALVRTVPDCTAVAFIGKTASIDVWAAGGGVAHRIGRGLAGPDLTLGMDVIHKATESCQASEIAVGADDSMTWGLVFDLAMAALHQPWTRTNAAVVVADAVPGHKVVWATPPASAL